MSYVFFLTLVFSQEIYAVSEKSISTFNTLRPTYLAEIGGSIEMRCNFTFGDGGSYITWKKGKTSLSRHDSAKPILRKQRYVYTIGSQEDYAALQIINITFDDAGEYTCKKTPKKAGTQEQQDLQINVQDGPHFKFISQPLENTTLTAECCATLTETDSLLYWWSLDGDFIHSNLTNATRDLEGSVCSKISLKASRKYHLKPLRCKIQNSLNLSAESVVQVMYPASAEWKPPTSNMKSTIAGVNTNINITCISDGFPYPIVSLERYDETLQTWMDTNVISEFMNREEIKTLWNFNYYFTSEVQERLRCVAYNNLTEIEESSGFIIEPLIPDNVYVIPISQTIRKDDNITITCFATGYPTPDVYIQKYVNEKWETVTVSVSMETSHFNRSDDMFRLDFQLLAISEDQTGKYRCRTNNTLDDFSYSDNIVVKLKVDPPSIVDLLLDNIQAVISITIGILVIMFLIATVAYQRRNSASIIIPTITRYGGRIRNSMHFGHIAHLEEATEGIPDVVRNENIMIHDRRNMPVNEKRNSTELLTDAYEELREKPLEDTGLQHVVNANQATGVVNYAVVQKGRTQKISAFTHDGIGDDDDYVGIRPTKEDFDSDI